MNAKGTFFDDPADLVISHFSCIVALASAARDAPGANDREYDSPKVFPIIV